MNREFVLSEAEAMYPLVRRILEDVTTEYVTVRSLQRRADALRDCRQSSKYDVRKQFHLAQRRLDDAERRLRGLTDEMEDLGVLTLDPVHGVAGFPFALSSGRSGKNVRRAFFLLKVSDPPRKGIKAWRFEREAMERAVPIDWQAQVSPPFQTDEVETAPDQ